MFCLNYYRFQEYIKQADELRIKYRKTDSTLKNFLEKYQDKTIIIEIGDDFDQLDSKIFKELQKDHKNFKLIVNYHQRKILDLILSNEIPFFFSNFITTIDELWGLMEYKPTDMYICEELGFHLDTVSKLLHEHNIKVRVIPNICQSSFSSTPGLKTFFIRPEDIDFYSNYVDVFEFISDAERQKTIFNVYKNGKWFGALEELIPTLKMHIDNRAILKDDFFAAPRVKCGKKCMYDPSSCRMCDRIVELSDIIIKNNLYLRNKPL